MEPYTRKIDLKITVDIWDWTKGQITETVDITNDTTAYQFQKSVKNPKGTCSVSVNPQFGDINILDYFSAMDVVKIYEFGNLKFQGYITRVSYSGSIAQDGKPARTGNLTVSQMGGLLYDGKTGMGIGVALGDQEAELWVQTNKLTVAISNAVNDGTEYSELIELVTENVKTYIRNLGGTAILNYLEEYMSYGDALATGLESVNPRSWELFTGTEASITFWEILDQLIEKPFFEFFIDNGPRNIEVNGKPVQLKEGSHMVFRPTPYDDTATSISSTLFTDMTAVKIEKDYLLGFALSKGMDEVYTVYSVKNAAHELADLARQYLGMYSIDETRLGKYMFRPLIIDQLYTRSEKIDATEQDGSVSTVENASQDLADTLKAWYEHNDEFVSGSISMMVPKDNDKDPKIGDKLEVYGIEGYLYVEGVSHTWQYGGALKASLSCTRGFNGTTAIEMKDKLFRRRQV